MRQRYTPFGGAERFVERAIDALADARRQSAACTRATWPRRATGASSPSSAIPYYVGSVWRDAGFARAVRAALARDRPDLVQTHERIEGCDIFRAGDGVHRAWLAERHARGRARRAARHRGESASPLPARRRGEGVRGPDAQGGDLHLADGARRRPPHFAVPDEKLHVIYNAVDPREFSPDVREHRAATRARLGFPTPTSSSCSSARAMRARAFRPRCARSRGCPPRARLVVVGRDKHPARYEALARRAGVHERVVFAGPQHDPRPYFGAADAFVLPTLYDPLANAVLEALACGLPVVTSRRCGAGELVAAHGAGSLCDADDDAALAAHMERLLDDAERANVAAHASGAVAALTPDAMTAGCSRSTRRCAARL